MSEINKKTKAVAKALPEKMFAMSAMDFYDKETGDVLMHRHEMTSIPEGFPTEIRGDFYCHDNKLTTLRGAPMEVGGDFKCYDNELTSLKGAPEKVGGNFYCDDNELTSLEGAPEKVGGGFHCVDNARKFTEEEVRAVCKVGGKVCV